MVKEERKRSDTSGAVPICSIINRHSTSSIKYIVLKKVLFYNNAAIHHCSALNYVMFLYGSMVLIIHLC